MRVPNFSRAEFFIFLYFIFAIVVLGAGGYILCHFISKFW